MLFAIKLIKILSISLTILIIWKIFKYFKSLYRKLNFLKTIPKAPSYIYRFLVTFTYEEPVQHFNNLRRYAQQFYPIYRFSFLHLQTVNLLNPDDIELVLSTRKHLSKSELYSYFHTWLGTGLLTSTGSKWHKRRRILTPAFHFDVLKEYVHIFNDETEKLLESLSKQNGRIVNVLSLVTNFTLQSVIETAMGLDNLDEPTQIHYKTAICDIKNTILERFCNPWFRNDFIYKFSELFKKEAKIVKILHEFSAKVILKREKEIDETGDVECKSRKKNLSMLDLLLSAKKQGSDIDYEGIREEVDTFMFEGHDTTATAISYLLLVLANLQDIQTQILREILAVLGPKKPPTYKDLQELKFTERCIKETLRLFPSVPVITRVCSEDFVTTTGHKIPEGISMNIHIFDLHRNERFYPDPLRFDPDRFLPENIAKRHPFAYLPFSAGPRNCIGQKFALLELKAALCGILRRFKLEKIRALEDVRFTMNLVLQPIDETPIEIKIIRREL